MTGPITFRTTVELGGKTATGLPVPDDVVLALGSGRRPGVVVTVGGHSYLSTIARMGGRWLIPLSAENRSAAGVAAGDQVEVQIAAETGPREIAVPDDLRTALDGDEVARDFFQGLAASHRKEWARWVEEAKRPETRAKRLQLTMDALREGRRTR